jgi:hypothetical protein
VQVGLHWLTVKKPVPYIPSKWAMFSLLTEFAYEQAGISGCDKSVGNLLYAVSTSVNLSVVCAFEIFLCVTYEVALTCG